MGKRVDRYLRLICFLVAGAALVTTLSLPAWGQYMHEPQSALTQNTLVPILQNVGIDQRLNQELPLDLNFRDETGHNVPLRAYFGQRPVILALAYYQCPMLCSQVLNGLVSSLLPLKLDVGKDFDVLTVSFDPRDTPAAATQKKNLYLPRYGRSGAEQGWHFLTGDPPAIAALTKAVGFRYAWDPKIQQYAHATAIMVLTPEGRIAQYYYGIEYAPRDLRLGLVQASQGRVGNVVDQVLLYCYHYDPATGKWGAVVTNLLRLGGGLTLLILGTFLVVMWRRDAHLKHANTGRAV